MEKWTMLIPWVLMACVAASQDEPEVADGDSDSDVDADADTDSDSASDSDTGSGTDSGSEVDDPCWSEFPGPSNAALAGCNGEPPGPACNGEYAGVCTQTERGDSCNQPWLSCVGVLGSEVGDPGMCFQGCPDDVPGEGPFTSTGGCPAGSRCFDLGYFSVCFADCTSDADCASFNCTEEGVCAAPVVGAAPEDPCASG